MFDVFRGLPVHALVVHAVVVLVPLSALGVVLIAVLPRWRERFGFAVLGIATAALVTVPVAVQSGLALKKRVGASGTIAKQISDHEKMGKLVLFPTLAMWVLALVLVLASRRGRTGRMVMILAVLAVLGAAAATAQVAITGELGSKAVWNCTLYPASCR